MSPAQQNTDTNVVTLKDVAEAAGVHISTVSRVLNPTRRKMVSNDVATRVIKIAKDMGYSTNPFAYGLRTKKSNTIGVIIPDLANPIFPPLIRGIEQRLSQSGYTAIFADTHESAEEESVIIKRVLARQVEGIVIATAQRKSDPLSTSTNNKIPSVLVNRGTENKDVLSVTNDDFYGAQLAVNHLISLGHKRIAHLAGPQSLTTGFQRRKGYLAAMKEHGLDTDKNLIISCGSFDFEGGKKGFKKLQNSDAPYTAIFAANDFLALGCYYEMRKKNIICPQDVSIIGYNDMPFSDMFDPALTTIKIDLNKMGNHAAELLLDRLEGQKTKLKSITLRPELVVRESTAPIK